MSQITVLEHQKPILEQLAKDRSKGKTLVVIPSGAGKTWIAALDSKQSNAKTGLYIAHKVEILRQAADVYKSVHNLKDNQIGFIEWRNKDFNSDFIFASNLALTKTKTLEKVKERTFDYLVIDEFHHVAAKTYQQIIKEINHKFLLGLTATPFRSDQRDILSSVENNISYDLTLEQGIKDGVLVPFVYNGLHDNIDYSDIVWQRVKYRENDLNKKLVIEKRDEQIVKEFQTYCRDRTTIGFCVTVKHCERITKRFNDNGISANYVTYYTPREQRNQIVQDFRNKKFQVLFVRDIFNEGIDFPEIQAVMFLRPTWSKTVFLQQLGRGLRKAHGKDDVLVLDFIGNYKFAFRHREWLKFAMQSMLPLGHRPYKPEYKHNVPYVYFDKKVVDIFEEQKRNYELYGAPKGEVKAYFAKVLPHEPPFPKSKEIKRPKFDFSASIIWKYWDNGLPGLLYELGRIDKDTRDHRIWPYWSHRHYVEEYFKAKSILGHSPSDDELLELSRQDKIKIKGRSWDSRYMSLGRFKKLIGEQDKFKSVRKHPEEYTIEDVADFYNALREQDKTLLITLEQFENVFPSLDSRLRRMWNLPWQKFLKKYAKDPIIKNKCLLCSKEFDTYVWNSSSTISDKTNRASRKYCSDSCKNRSLRTTFSKDECIANYNNMKQILGRIPNFHDLNNRNISHISPRPYTYYWKTWLGFLQDIGEINKDVHPILRCTKQDVIDNYKDIISRLGRMPTREELYDKNISKYSVVAMQYFWGSYGKFLQDQGYPLYKTTSEARQKKLTFDELRDMMKKLQQKLGRKNISVQEWEKEYGIRRVIQDMFGSFVRFKQELGILEFHRKCKLCKRPFRVTSYNQIYCTAHITRKEPK